LNTIISTIWEVQVLYIFAKNPLKRALMQKSI